MMTEPLDFEALFNDAYRIIGDDEFGNPGRAVLNANSFSNPGPLGVLALRGFQTAVAVLVNTGELEDAFNEKASNVVTNEDAHTLLEEIKTARMARS